MNNIEVFQFPDTGQPIRVIGDADTPLVHHADSCRALGHTNPSVALRLVDEDERVLIDMRTLPAGQTALNSAEGGQFKTPATGNAHAWFLTEAGFYNLALRSNAPNARKFRRWVTHDILPTIRKTGAYGQRELTRLELINLARDAELGRLAAVEAQQAAEQKVTALEPKAAYVDQFVGATGDACILRVFAGQLGIGEHALREYLIARKVIYRQAGQRWSKSKQEWETDNSYFAYAQYKAWFKPGDQPEAPRRHNGQMRTTLYVTPAGKVGISRLLARHPLAIAAGENPT